MGEVVVGGIFGKLIFVFLIFVFIVFKRIKLNMYYIYLQIYLLISGLVIGYKYKIYVVIIGKFVFNFEFN